VKQQLIKDAYPGNEDDDNAFENALEELQRMALEDRFATNQLPPLKSLEWSDGIALAARDHCADSKATGSQYLLGSDGSMTWGRISRYGRAPKTVGEVLGFGLTEAEDIVM
jgi:uncharacterized protein YkwD